jgi:hypothetical protein
MGSDPVLEGLLRRSRPFITDVHLRAEIDRFLAGDGSPTWETTDKGIYYCFFSGIGLRVSRDFAGCRWEIGTMVVNPAVTVIKVFLAGIEQSLEEAQERALNAARFITVQRGRKEEEDSVYVRDQRGHRPGTAGANNTGRANPPRAGSGSTQRQAVSAAASRPRSRATGFGNDA